MALKVTIGSTDWGVMPGSLRFSDRVGGVPTAKFTVRRAAGGTLIERGEEVVIWDDELEETIRQTVPGATPPGLRYRTDHEGYLLCDFPFAAHEDGTMEVIYAPLYNLPDLSAYVEEDTYISGAKLHNGEHTSWVEVGVVWVYAESKYKYYAELHTHVGETFYETVLISATELVLSTSNRIAVTWETAEGGASSDFALYVDGVLEDSDTGTGTMSGYYTEDPNRAYIAGQYAFLGIGAYFADFRLWLDVRTAEELAATAFARLAGDDLTDANLEGYWKIDEGTGTDIIDAGPAGNDGEMVDEGDGYMEWANAPDTWIEGEGDPSCTDALVDLRYFGGYVSTVDREIIGPVVEQHVSCDGYAVLCSRYRAGINFVNPHPGKYFAQYLAQIALLGHDVGYGCMPEGSRNILVSDWTNSMIKAALDETASSTGWVWYIDPYKEMRYHPRGYRAAPWNIASTDDPGKFLLDSINVGEDLDGYYNRLHARVRYTDDEDVQHTLVVTLSDDAAIAERIAAEGGDGVYEHYADLPDAVSPEHGLDQAYGMLKAASTLGQTVSYVTIGTGLRAGMVQTIDLPDVGLSGEYLVEAIDTELKGAASLFHKVKLSSWNTLKESPLDGVLAASLASKKNWREAVLMDGYGSVDEHAASVGVGVTFDLESGDIE